METTGASSGGPFGLFNVHSAAYGQLSVRSWRPTAEGEWKQAKPYSFFDAADVGLTSTSWSHFPGASAPSLAPFLLEMERAEVLINSPSFLSRPATAN